MQYQCIFSCSLPGPLPGLLGRPPKTQTSAAGQCAGRRSGYVPFQGVGAAVGVTVRPLAPPLGELLSGCEAERASTPTNTQKGSGSRSQEPLPAVLWGM